MTDNTDAPAMNVSLQINLAINDKLKWGDLYWFVDQARKSGVQPEDDVYLEYSEDDYRELEGLVAFVDPNKLHQ